MKYVDLKPGDALVDSDVHREDPACLLLSIVPPASDDDRFYRMVWLAPHGIIETQPDALIDIPEYYHKL